MEQHQQPEWIDTVSTAERRILDLRAIGMQHALALGHLHYHQASAPLAEQTHDHWLVLVFLLSGQQRYVVEGKELVLQGGQMLKIPPGHRYSTGAWPEQKGDLAWLILHVDPLPDGPALGMSGDGARSVFEMLARPSGPLVHPMAEDAPKLLKSAFAWWERRDEALGREMIRNRVAGLAMGAAAAMILRASTSEDHAMSQRIRAVMRWLDEHPGEMPSVAEMARMARLSPTSFHKHFKLITGSSPKDYRLRLSVERAACRLREHPGLTVTEVAHEFGFSSSQYFATVFRRYLGVSPSDCRNQISGSPGR
jgi:AraC-like DNA-binding protein